jgi:hypothetical protein
MAAMVDSPQARIRDVEVFLRRRQTLVPQKDLNRPQIGAAVK